MFEEQDYTICYIANNHLSNFIAGSVYSTPNNETILKRDLMVPFIQWMPLAFVKLVATYFKNESMEQ